MFCNEVFSRKKWSFFLFQYFESVNIQIFNLVIVIRFQRTWFHILLIFSVSIRHSIIEKGHIINLFHYSRCIDFKWNKYPVRWSISIKTFLKRKGDVSFSFTFISNLRSTVYISTRWFEETLRPLQARVTCMK